MPQRTFDIYKYISDNADDLATAIVEKYTTWLDAKQGWEAVYRSCLEYLFATDTSAITDLQTSEYSSTTHIPKLTQVRDIITTYYLEALFSLEDYVQWRGMSLDDLVIKKRNAITDFVKQMLNDGNFKDVVSKLVEDYFDAGNAFAMPVWRVDKDDQGTYWEGVVAQRIDPLDIVFDPTVKDFKDTPKIIRTVLSLGDLKVLSDQDPVMKEAFDRMRKQRQELKDMRATFTNGDEIINNELNIAGFSALDTYLLSDTVELLTFIGTLYDVTNDKLYKDKKITIVDRSIILKIEDMEGICNNNYIFKAGWRDRKDVLWSMSPVENLLGMQYRIDFLENKKADVYDYVANPMLVVKGEVSRPEVISPGGEFACDKDSDVRYLVPDTTILSADNQVAIYENRIEMFAGAPREAAGFRTPGEKTAFEYAQLMNASSRMFNRKIQKFEHEIFEPLINACFQLYLKRKAGQTVNIKTWDYINNVEDVITVNVDELQGEGSLKAIGTAYYSDKSQVAQNLQMLGQNPLFLDEAVRANFSPAMLGRIFAHVTDLDKFDDLFRKNQRLYETADQQKLVSRLMQQVDEVNAAGLAKAQQLRQDMNLETEEIPEEAPVNG